MKKLNCTHEEMTVLDIILTEIGSGDLQLEEDVPFLGQAQTVLLVVGVVAVPLAWTDQEIVLRMLVLFRPHIC